MSRWRSQEDSLLGGKGRIPSFQDLAGHKLKLESVPMSMDRHAYRFIIGIPVKLPIFVRELQMVNVQNSVVRPSSLIRSRQLKSRRRTSRWRPTLSTIPRNSAKINNRLISPPNSNLQTRQLLSKRTRRRLSSTNQLFGGRRDRPGTLLQCTSTP